MSERVKSLKSSASSPAGLFQLYRDRKPNPNSLKQAAGLPNCKQLKSQGVSGTAGSRG